MNQTNKKQKKFYAVKSGFNTGIFDDWNIAKKSVTGYKNAVYKSFATKKEALDFLSSNSNEIKEINDPKTAKQDMDEALANNYTVVFVDGSYNEINHLAGYGIVILFKQNDELIKNTISDSLTAKATSSRNVTGEIVGVMKAIEWLANNNHKKIKLYFDYLGIQKWTNGMWKANSTIATTYTKFMAENMPLFEEFCFVKVKAHSNITYNDIADLLAKKAVGLVK